MEGNAAYHAEGTYGRLYQVRRSGRQPEIVGHMKFRHTDRAAFEEVRKLMADPAYDGDDPEYWMVESDASSLIYAGDTDREWLVNRHSEKMILPLRFPEAVEQVSLSSYLGVSQ